MEESTVGDIGCMLMTESQVQDRMRPLPSSLRVRFPIHVMLLERVVACGVRVNLNLMDTVDTNPPSGPSTTIFLQDACLQHKYIRTKDSSHIVERPERLRAVKIGLSAAISRLEESLPVVTSASTTTTTRAEDPEADPLVDAFENLRLERQDSVKLPLAKQLPVQVVRSSAKVDILNHPAVKYVHGDVDGDVYPEKLVEWARQSAEKISNGQCEIPEGLPQGDMYSKV